MHFKMMPDTAAMPTLDSTLIEDRTKYLNELTWLNLILLQGEICLMSAQVIRLEHCLKQEARCHSQLHANKKI